jgi:uncharacterized protein (TIGR00725 family)
VTRYVAVVGGYEVDGDVLAMAEEVGRRLAERGVVVVTGGRSGVADAASMGAAAAGGVAIGVLPGTDRSEANPWVSYALTTGLGDTRNALVAMNGDAVIALDGAAGTLSEIAHALVLRRPVVGLGTWTLQRRGVEPDAIVRVSTPAEAVEAALRAVDGDGAGPR